MNAAALAAIVSGWLLERVVKQQPATCTFNWVNLSGRPAGASLLGEVGGGRKQGKGLRWLEA